MIQLWGTPPRQRVSSTCQRARPIPGTGSGVEGRGVMRHRVRAAFGAGSARGGARRSATAITPDFSAASTSRRDAVIGSRDTSPTTAASPGWRNASSIASSTVFSSGAWA
jgi:hypothetical protein